MLTKEQQELLCEATRMACQHATRVVERWESYQKVLTRGIRMHNDDDRENAAHCFAVACTKEYEITGSCDSTSRLVDALGYSQEEVQ